MKSIFGLAEYTMTGGFLWILFLVFATLIGIENHVASSVSELWREWLNYIPLFDRSLEGGQAAAKDTIPAVASGVLLIGIFTTGLMLDLVAPSVFVALEIGWTKKWLLRNRSGWFSALIERHGGLVSGDYSALTAKSVFGLPPIWQVSQYQRLMLFLVSYVMAASTPGQQEEIGEEMKLWRVSRALSVSLFLLSVLLTSWVLMRGSGTNFTLGALPLGIIAPWVALVFSYFMARTTFCRLVVSLQAAMYLAWQRSERESAGPSHEKSQAQRPTGRGVPRENLPKVVPVAPRL